MSAFPPPPPADFLYYFLSRGAPEGWKGNINNNRRTTPHWDAPPPRPKQTSTTQGEGQEVEGWVLRGRGTGSTVEEEGP